MHRPSNLMGSLGNISISIRFDGSSDVVVSSSVKFQRAVKTFSKTNPDAMQRACGCCVRIQKVEEDDLAGRRLSELKAPEMKALCKIRNYVNVVSFIPGKNKSYALICDLWVLLEARKLKMSTRIVEELVKIAQRKGVKLIFAVVDAKNAAAKQAHITNGFQIIIDTENEKGPILRAREA
ncbi:retrovirus-related pol polyprotein from transposon TNT 1-94 [Tanacetum coccineum]